MREPGENEHVEGVMSVTRKRIMGVDMIITHTCKHLVHEDDGVQESHITIEAVADLGEPFGKMDILAYSSEMDVAEHEKHEGKGIASFVCHPSMSQARVAMVLEEVRRSYKYAGMAMPDTQAVLQGRVVDQDSDLASIVAEMMSRRGD